ncbi:MAG: tRNA(Ile)(2)-agmatinylcytidine synthase [Candidatus Altiarchaeota archaeon]
MLIGIDDTDSNTGMCTTYLAAKLCQRLNVKKTPKLVRLNPNIPYKTRGNGAIAFETEAEDAEKVVLSYVKEYSMLTDENTNPGVAFLESDKIPEQLNRFYRKAVSELVSIEEAEKVAPSANVTIHKFKNGRGIIGALAALGLNGDRTYELIAYRRPENYGKPRRIDRQSVVDMDISMYPRVFDNLDAKKRRILITPKGRDPIFCGIRGVTEHDVLAAWNMVRPLEDIECTQLFETNQATDAHLRRKEISKIRSYDCVIVDGVVSSKPKILPGGHVIFTLKDGSGSIDCAAYKPSGVFRKAVGLLLPGDRVLACGGVGKYPGTINLEKIEVKSLAELTQREPPLCCGKRMTSSGKDKGYKCRKCHKKVSQEKTKISQKVRELMPGIYDAPPGSRRHLSKPAFMQGSSIP